MGSATLPTKNTNLSHFTPAEKCTAIYRWQQSSNVTFDLSFVESIHDYYIQRGRCSDKQIAALDKILNKFNIDLDRWCM